MKKVLLTLLVTILSLSLVIIPVSAQKNNSQSKDRPSLGTNINKSNLDKLSSEQIKQRLEKAQADLERTTERLEKFKAKLEAISEKGEAKRNKHEKLIDEKEASWQEQLDKMAEKDKQELAKLEEEYNRWKEHNDNMTASLNEELSKIDANLTEALAQIDKEIAAATDNTLKQNLEQRKVELKANADARKQAINKYLTELQAIWIERQKEYEVQKVLLTRRQSADMEFSKAMMQIRNSEMLSSGALNKEDVACANRYQIQIRILNKRIERLNATIAELKAALEKAEGESQEPADSTPSADTSTQTTPSN